MLPGAGSLSRARRLVRAVTLVGTLPNLPFARVFEIIFPEAEAIAFGTGLRLPKQTL